MNAWRCELHGTITTSDCPNCDDEQIALANELFVDVDAENEPTLWRGDPDHNPSAVLRRCDLPAQHRDLWDRFVGGGSDV